MPACLCHPLLAARSPQQPRWSPVAPLHPRSLVLVARGGPEWRARRCGNPRQAVPPLLSGLGIVFILNDVVWGAVISGCWGLPTAHLCTPSLGQRTLLPAVGRAAWGRSLAHRPSQPHSAWPGSLRGLRLSPAGNTEERQAFPLAGTSFSKVQAQKPGKLWATGQGGRWQRAGQDGAGGAALGVSTFVPHACPRTKGEVRGPGVRQRARVLEEILGTPRPAGRSGAPAPSLPPHTLPQSQIASPLPRATARAQGHYTPTTPCGSKSLGVGEQGSPASEGPHQFPHSTPGGHTTVGLGAKVHTAWAPDSQAGCRGGAPCPPGLPGPFDPHGRTQGRSAKAMGLWLGQHRGRPHRRDVGF